MRCTFILTPLKELDKHASEDELQIRTELKMRAIKIYQKLNIINKNKKNTMSTVLLTYELVSN